MNGGGRHHLLARQLAGVTSSDGRVDLERLLPLIEAVYRDIDRDRQRNERASSYLAEEMVVLGHERKQLLAELRIQNTRFEAALENMSQGLCLLDAEARLIVSNRRFGELFQLPPGWNRAGVHVAEILASSPVLEDASTYLQLAAAPHYDFLRQELGNGRIIAIAHQPLPDGGCVDTFQDITEQHHAQQRVAHMSQHDPLTDLPNRMLLHEGLQSTLLRCAHGERCAVLYLDLDRFKTVNDTLGHPIGDALLIAVAERLRRTLRKPDLVARVGGDEFIIVLGNASDASTVAEVARRIVREISRPYLLQEQQVVIGASIGIAMVPPEGGDAHQLIKHADLALYDAKRAGRGCHRFYGDPGATPGANTDAPSAETSASGL